MKIKTAELTGAALDWAVAFCEGAVNPPKETTWEDVKDLAVPFQMWEVTFNDKGRYWISPITVTRCGVDESVGATAPSISAIDHKGHAFRGSIENYYLTALEAEKEVRVQTYGDLSNPVSYSTDWALGGPLIERERITLDARESDWQARIWNPDTCDFIEVGRRGAYCQTPLIAAMRCLCLAKFGDEIEIPDELA